MCSLLRYSFLNNFSILCPANKNMKMRTLDNIQHFSKIGDPPPPKKRNGTETATTPAYLQCLRSILLSRLWRQMSTTTIVLLCASHEQGKGMLCSLMINVLYLINVFQRFFGLQNINEIRNIIVSTCTSKYRFQMDHEYLNSCKKHCCAYLHLIFF